MNLHILSGQFETYAQEFRLVARAKVLPAPVGHWQWPVLVLTRAINLAAGGGARAGSHLGLAQRQLGAVGPIASHQLVWSGLVGLAWRAHSNGSARVSGQTCLAPLLTCLVPQPRSGKRSS